MAKKRVFPEKPLTDKTSKVHQNKFKNKKGNNKQNIFIKKFSGVAQNFFAKSTANKIIDVDHSTSESFKPSRQSVTEGQFKVEKNKKENQTQVKEKNDDVKETKKPFDKKLFRLKKYSNKYKLEQWEEKRKKSILREFHKSIKNEKTPKFDVAKVYEEEEEEGTKGPNRELNEELEKPKKNNKPFLKPHERFQRIKEEKEKKREEMMRKQAEREKAIKEANKQRHERNKKLSRKTKKGQPIMSYRMEMLLEKIEKSLKN